MQVLSSIVSTTSTLSGANGTAWVCRLITFY
jgi:hypothetical protein